MGMKLDVYGYKLGLGLDRLVKAGINGAGIGVGQSASLRFLDPAYAVFRQGARPVEILVGGDGVVQRITEYWLFGVNGVVQLTKMMEFDFAKRRFTCFGVHRRLSAGLRAFWCWRRVFLGYHKAGVYKLEISEV